MLKAIDHKAWPNLKKMDEIMPKSTATGRFAHDGANKKKLEDGDSVGQSDRDSMYGPDVNQGPSFAFFSTIRYCPFYGVVANRDGCDIH